MLVFLEVNNIALIENETIEFDEGLNVITGETGAGKSLLINSLGILLGNKIDKNLIRKDTEQCKIVGKFSVESDKMTEINELLNKYDIEIADDIMLSRSYNIKGKSDIRINGQLSTLNVLRELSSILMDAYFQNDNQKIFDKEQHLKILDDYSQVAKLSDFAEYQEQYNKLNAIQNEIKKFGEDDFERQTKIDVLSYQANEIKQAELSQEELEDLKSKKQIMANIGKIISNTTIAFESISGQTTSNISRAKSSLGQASTYDENLNKLYERLDSIQIELDDISDELQNYNQKFDFSEAEQQRVEDRIDTYNKIFRKYGVSSTEELEEKYNKIITELNALQNSTERLEELKNEKTIVIKNLLDIGNRLHTYREKYSQILSDKIQENIRQLGMKNAVVNFEFAEIDFENPKFYKDGLDKVEIMFSANLGETPKQLAQIASGGEISRFMLALKAEIAASDNTGTIVFDEIDTGISGNVVEQVAKQMAKISKNHQVIVVTHSGQICAMADTNYLIYKTEQNNSSTTNIKKLDRDGKIKEVARFMSGEQLTEKSIANAVELIEIQDKFKKELTNNSSI